MGLKKSFQSKIRKLESFLKKSKDKHATIVTIASLWRPKLQCLRIRFTESSERESSNSTTSGINYWKYMQLT